MAAFSSGNTDEALTDRYRTSYPIAIPFTQNAIPQHNANAPSPSYMSPSGGANVPLPS